MMAQNNEYAGKNVWSWVHLKLRKIKQEFKPLHNYLQLWKKSLVSLYTILVVVNNKKI